MHAITECERAYIVGIAVGREGAALRVRDDVLWSADGGILLLDHIALDHHTNLLVGHCVAHKLLELDHGELGQLPAAHHLRALRGQHALEIKLTVRQHQAASLALLPSHDLLHVQDLETRRNARVAVHHLLDGAMRQHGY